jgi:hypothetical protein
MEGRVEGRKSSVAETQSELVRASFVLEDHVYCAAVVIHVHREARVDSLGAHSFVELLEAVEVDEAEFVDWHVEVGNGRFENVAEVRGLIVGHDGQLVAVLNDLDSRIDGRESFEHVNVALVVF